LIYKERMDPFSYLSVLTSTVLALGIARLLTGGGKLLQARRRLRLYWVHLLWAFNVFLYLVLTWWILFRWRCQGQWTFFLFLLLSPIVGFLLAVLLFPDSLEDGADLREHFFWSRRSFSVLGALLAPIDAIDTLLKGWHHFLSQGPLYVATLLLVFVLNVVAASRAAKVSTPSLQFSSSSSSWPSSASTCES